MEGGGSIMWSTKGGTSRGHNRSRRPGIGKASTFFAHGKTIRGVKWNRRQESPRAPTGFFSIALAYGSRIKMFETYKYGRARGAHAAHGTARVRARYLLLVPFGHSQRRFSPAVSAATAAPQRRRGCGSCLDPRPHRPRGQRIELPNERLRVESHRA